MNFNIDEMIEFTEDKLRREKIYLKKLEHKYNEYKEVLKESICVSKLALACLLDLKAGRVMVPSEPTDDMCKAYATPICGEKWDIFKGVTSEFVEEFIKAAPKSHIAQLMESE